MITSPSKVEFKVVPIDPTPSIITCGKYRLPLPGLADAELDSETPTSPSKLRDPPDDDAETATDPSTMRLTPYITEIESITVPEMVMGI
jgi:hypothetical protein